ncbi:MAG: oxygen-independent coproporphyrinogen III oxidase [Rhodospirillales bacterium]|nr:MAG: oxygen-independent coproporphyrinogen III oxidase [Rhodospirillales bacterium]
MTVATVSLETLADRYDLRVPRYTSYPTAPHFGPDVSAETYGAWLAALEPGTPLSLYFHIPFCDSMCWFCGCYTKVVQRYEPVRAYLDVLAAEIDLVASALRGRFGARHLHWGGGSPTLLRPDDWLALTEHLRDRFDIAPGAELAVELDPRDATEDYVRALAAAGVSRVSIGVQDFDARVQAAIGRHQPFDVVERVCAWLRAHGIEDINLDLMYGLPHQTCAGVTAMVDTAHHLAPSRLALFGYAHVPWMKSHQRLIDETALPGAADRLVQFRAAADRLMALGYRAIGLDHFARPDDALARAARTGRLRRNFQGYTADDAAVLLGFGASAIGSLPVGYVQNTAPLRDYAEAVGTGRLPIARGFALGAEDRLRGEVIEQLMCQLDVDVPAVCRCHGFPADMLAAETASLGPLAADGLVTLSDGRVTITRIGQPFVRLAAAAFDAYLPSGRARHSRAV